MSDVYESVGYDDVATGAAAEDAKAITERVKTHMHTFLYNSLQLLNFLQKLR